MASLYEINKQIAEIMEKMFTEVDEETGELNEDYITILHGLNVCKDEKLENIGCYIKNLMAEAEAIKAEIKTLKERMDSKTKKVERLKQIVINQLIEDGIDKFEAPRCAFSFRNSEAVEISDESRLPREFLAQKVEFVPNKTEIKNAIKRGADVPGASLVTRKNLMMK